MKRILLLVALALPLGGAAQQAFDDIRADVRRSAANYYAYPTPTASLTPAPKGYEPFYLSHYARHGSRWLIQPDQYNKPLATLRRADTLGKLTPRGREVLAVLDTVARLAAGRYGELTALGARQHQGIAQRMYERFPEVFRSTVDARSTVVIRCILSMTAECLRLQALNPKLHFTNDASQHDMYYMNDERSEELRTLRRADTLRVVADRYTERFVRPDRLMRTLFADDAYVRDSVKAGRLMQELFTVAANMQSLDVPYDLYPLFTVEECYDLWRRGNISWYVNYANSPLTKGRMPFSQTNLLRNFIETADTCLRRTAPSATLRFGHEVVVLPLACLLELDDYGAAYNDLDRLDEHWRNYEIFPMGSNVQLVFYRRKDGGDILVKALLNEREVRLPVPTRTAPYYKWSDLRAYYLRKLNTP